MASLTSAGIVATVLALAAPRSVLSHAVVPPAVLQATMPPTAPAPPAIGRQAAVPQETAGAATAEQVAAPRHSAPRSSLSPAARAPLSPPAAPRSPSQLAEPIAPGQEPANANGAWRCLAIERTHATAFAICWRHGFACDAAAEAGAAAAVAEYRLARARRAVPDVTASGVTVLTDATVAHVLVPARAAARGIAFCRALADDTAPLDDDLAAQAIARAALAADDADAIYPGQVLAGRARRALLGGVLANGVAGSAAAIAALTPAQLRERLAAPVHADGLALGALTDAVQRELADVPLPRGPLAPPAEAGPIGPPPAGSEQHPHARLDGPFAALAFAVAEGADLPALAVAVEVAKMRAARELRLRGSEARARAPVVGWSWLDGDPLLLFCRRGRDGADPAPAFAEIEALLADLRTREPTAAELDIALRTLRWELGLVPLPPGTDGEALPGRAVALLLADLRGVTAEGLEAVTAARARAALASVAGEASAWHGALVPAEPAGPR